MALKRGSHGKECDNGNGAGRAQHAKSNSSPKKKRHRRIETMLDKTTPACFSVECNVCSHDQTCSQERSFKPPCGETSWRIPRSAQNPVENYRCDDQVSQRISEKPLFPCRPEIVSEVIARRGAAERRNRRNQQYREQTV